MPGKIYTAANGQKSYEVFDASAGLVSVLARLLEEHFEFILITKPVIGVDEVIAEVIRGEIKLGLGWDNWSGAYIMAFCDEGSGLLDEISLFLDNELQKEAYMEFLSKSPDNIFH